MTPATEVAVAKIDATSTPAPPDVVAEDEPVAGPTSSAFLGPAPMPTPGPQPSPSAWGGAGGPFDRGAAARALGGVNLQSCATTKGPRGAGHVTVSFEPSGAVISASIDAGPYPGTAAGACIMQQLRGIRVPPFSGAPVRVGKSFTIH